MNVETKELIAALLIAAPGIIGLLLQWRDYIEKAKKTKAEALLTEKSAAKTEKDAKKTDVEATDTLTDIALSMVKPLQDENTRLVNQVNSLLERLTACEKGVDECKIARKDFLVKFEMLWKGAKALETQITQMDETPVFDVPDFPETGIITQPLPKPKRSKQ